MELKCLIAQNVKRCLRKQLDQDANFVINVGIIQKEVLQRKNEQTKDLSNIICCLNSWTFNFYVLDGVLVEE